jgi:DNA-binding MarR family transcriptional regulator
VLRVDYRPDVTIGAYQYTISGAQSVCGQVAKLESLRYVHRRVSQVDSRVNEGVINNKGKGVTDALNRTRQQLAEQLLKDWSKKDLKELTRLMRRFVNDLMARK